MMKCAKVFSSLFKGKYLNKGSGLMCDPKGNSSQCLARGTCAKVKYSITRYKVSTVGWLHSSNESS